MTFAFCYSSINTEVTPQAQPRGTVLNSGATGSQLWLLPRLLCGVSLWQQWVSVIEPLRSWQQLCEPSHFGLSMAYPSRSLWLMWHHWRLALTVFLYRSFSLRWFLLPGCSSPCIRRLGIRHSAIRITYPTYRSWALMMVAFMLVDLVWSKTSRLVMWSCHLIPRMERRSRMWNSSSFLIYLRYSVHVSQPERREGGKNHGIVYLQFQLRTSPTSRRCWSRKHPSHCNWRRPGQSWKSLIIDTNFGRHPMRSRTIQSASLLTVSKALVRSMNTE